ncbi:MAG TPA: proline iminopeptidase-family hydrolase [Thermoanaerobaculia bacterium]|nr:proline iminopeptidase-family hydrolase [Thermoanaerobaculia bacterium]
MTLDRRTFLCGAAALAGSAAVGLGQARPPSKAGEIKTAGIRLIPIDGGKYKVWTKKVGTGRIKMLTLHGGPGVTHEYFECFEDFLPGAGIEFYYYDQLGSAYSDQPDDTSLWTIDRFREEVEQVRSALGLTNFYLLGHSWGGMLGIEYALKYQKYLRGFVLSSMTASIPSYMEYAAKLRAELPKDVLAILEKYEKAGNYQAPEYQETMFKQMYSRHVCRLDPWPDPLDRAFKHLNEKVYNTMQGPNEFVVTGNFKDWDRWKDLPQIKVPTFVVSGKYDEMNPDDMKREGKLIPNSRVLLCENGSHMCLWDDQDAYFRGLLGWIRDVEAGAAGPKRADSGRAQAPSLSS